ncbi:MAG: cell division protein ZapB [Thermodesulfobacteriota bacterium]|nr:MAG: cell division protein ZapB [Thermodesulfobacteriota bacterium]
MVIEQFERLEAGLLRLLAAHEAASAEKEALKAEISSKDIEIAELKKNLKRLEGERDQVREKVDGLLARLETLIQGA